MFGIKSLKQIDWLLLLVLLWNSEVNRIIFSPLLMLNVTSIFFFFFFNLDSQFRNHPVAVAVFLRGKSTQFIT